MGAGAGVGGEAGDLLRAEQVETAGQLYVSDRARWVVGAVVNGFS